VGWRAAAKVGVKVGVTVEEKAGWRAAATVAVMAEMMVEL
jgi:hypothetical protein